MIELTKVLPVSLVLSKSGKKVPRGGMSAKNKIDYKPGMHNFAIHLQDYPNIVVLDLDTKEHELIKYIDQTYTHETRKGWHCFFKNTYKMTTKRQKQAMKFDLLAGNNWCFYDYNDPSVAMYKEYNQLPLIEMPAELYDLVKTKASDLGEDVVGRFIPEPLLNILKTHKSLWDKQQGKWIPGRIYDTDEYNRPLRTFNYDSSALAWGVIKELVAYTDEPEHIAAVLKLIPEVGEKHSQIDYLTKWNNEGSIGAAKRHISATKAVTWRPLSDFRYVAVGNKNMFADIDNGQLKGPDFVSLCILNHIKPLVLQQFVETYHKIEFRPDLNERFSEGLYNTFDGFIEPEEGNDHEMYLNYIKDIICDGNEEHYQYLINYMAHMVQYPAERPDVALVLFGHDKGTGKDTFHNLFGKVLKGSGYVQLTEEMLAGRFNSPLERCLLGVAEELVFGGSHKEDSKLKKLITSELHAIERKGIETYEIRNYIRLIVTSNSSRPVRATPGERRYFALQPNTKEKGNFKFWQELYETFNPKHLLYYLMNRDIKSINFNPRDIPDSKSLREIIDHNKDKVTEAIELWWEDRYEGDRIVTKKVYEELVEDKKYITLRQFTTRMYQVCGKDHFIKSYNKDLGNHYTIMGINRIREIVEDNLAKVEV